jgi:hypothetical protein
MLAVSSISHVFFLSPTRQRRYGDGAQKEILDKPE